MREDAGVCAYLTDSSRCGSSGGAGLHRAGGRIALRSDSVEELGELHPCAILVLLTSRCLCGARHQQSIAGAGPLQLESPGCLRAANQVGGGTARGEDERRVRSGGEKERDGLILERIGEQMQRNESE